MIRLKPNGSLDSSFGNKGFIEYDAESEFGDPYYFFGGQLTSDGKLLFSGTDDYTSSCVLRVTNNGVPDETFGTSGLVTFNYFEGTRLIYNASASSSTSTWIGGFEKVQNQYLFLAGKRTNSGAADASFGTGGFATFPINNNDAIGYTVKEVDNGKVLLIGFGMFEHYYGITILQLMSNGNPDNSFGSNGILYIKGVDPARNTKKISPTTSLSHIISGPDNTTLITGIYEDGGANEGSIFIQRLSENGSPDNSFGTNSLTTITPLYGCNLIKSFSFGTANGKLARQPDGKILLAYSVYDIFTGFNIMLQRLTATGQPDPAFGTSGRTLFQASDNPFEEFIILDMKVAPNGKIALAAMYEDYDLDKIQTPIFQFSDIGFADNSFSEDGKLIPNYAAGKLSYTTDNKIFALGSRNKDLNGCCMGLAIGKYNTNGSNDNSFNGSGVVYFKYSTDDDMPVALILEPANEVTVLFSPFNSNRDYGIAKFNNNGTPVSGWGINGVLTVAGSGFSQYWQDGVKLENGGFVFAGQNETDEYILNILKTLPNGLPDNSFSTNGIGDISFQPALAYQLSGLVLKPGGKLLAGGNELVENLFNNESLNAVITQIKTSASVALVYTMINPGNWSNPANWQGGQLPPSTIPAGTEVIVNPSGNGEAVLDINVVVQSGGKITIKPGKKFIVVSSLKVPSITTQ
jgi:uncharacterized delta-60 repeat protein